MNRVGWKQANKDEGKKKEKVSPFIEKLIFHLFPSVRVKEEQVGSGLQDVKHSRLCWLRVSNRIKARLRA